MGRALDELSDQTSDQHGKGVVTDPNPPRCRPLAPEVVEAAADVGDGTPDAELLDRLEEALAQLPSPERAAVVTTLGYGEDVAAVAADLRLPWRRPRSSSAAPCNSSAARWPIPSRLTANSSRAWAAGAAQRDAAERTERAGRRRLSG